MLAKMWISPIIGRYHYDYDWLVVSTPLKNISQWEGLSHILWKIKNVPNHQPDDGLNSLQ
jgi:hypothetical protein